MADEAEQTAEQDDPPTRLDDLAYDVLTEVLGHLAQLDGPRPTSLVQLTRSNHALRAAALLRLEADWLLIEGEPIRLHTDRKARPDGVWPRPTFVATLPSGDIAVSDSGDVDNVRADWNSRGGRVRLLTASGSEYDALDARRTGIRHWTPTGLVAGAGGASVLVADVSSTLGTGEQSPPGAVYELGLPGGEVVGRGTGGASAGPHRLKYPLGACRGSRQRHLIFVVDSDHHRVVALDPRRFDRGGGGGGGEGGGSTDGGGADGGGGGAGEPASAAAWGISSTGSLAPAFHAFAFGGLGSAPGQLRDPFGICAHEGVLYVTDSGNHRVCCFREADGAFIDTIIGPANKRHSSGALLKGVSHFFTAEWRGSASTSTSGADPGGRAARRASRQHDIFLRDPSGIAVCRERLLVAESGGRLLILSLPKRGVRPGPPAPAPAAAATSATDAAAAAAADEEVLLEAPRVLQNLTLSKTGGLGGVCAEESRVLVANHRRGLLHVLEPVAPGLRLPRRPAAAGGAAAASGMSSAAAAPPAAGRREPTPPPAAAADEWEDLRRFTFELD